MTQIYTDIKNPRWADQAQTIINCEVQFTHIPNEYIPFTASEVDSESHGIEIFQRVISGEFGIIQEYIPRFSQEQLTEAKWEVLRQERDRLLYQTDWTQLPVNPLTPEQKVLWETYRQALRDLPDNTIDIDTVVWPTPP